MFPSSLSISDKGLAFLRAREGFKSRVYHDAAGNPTIGYGHKLLPGETFSEGISEQAARELLAHDAAFAQKAVKRSVLVELTQNQFDALVSFTFNEGAQAFTRSTLLQCLNAGDFSAAGNALLEWNKVTNAKGIKIPDDGLTARREAERDLFLNAVY